jgi:hypothetical protein
VDRRPPATRASAALSADELAAVVRRASELDAVVPVHETDLDVDEARLVLREAGVSSGAAEQALAEWRRGDLVVAAPPPIADPGGTLLLDEVGRLRLDLTPGKQGTSAVRLTADLGGLRSRLLNGLVALPAAAGAAVSLVGIPTSAPELIAGGLPVGLAVAGGGYLGASRTLERRKARVDESLHILLDRLGGRG